MVSHTQSLTFHQVYRCLKVQNQLFGLYCHSQAADFIALDLDVQFASYGCVQFHLLFGRMLCMLSFIAFASYSRYNQIIHLST